jgi:hypothetical protein
MFRELLNVCLEFPKVLRITVLGGGTLSIVQYSKTSFGNWIFSRPSWIPQKEMTSVSGLIKVSSFYGPNRIGAFYLSIYNFKNSLNVLFIGT